MCSAGLGHQQRLVEPPHRGTVDAVTRHEIGAPFVERNRLAVWAGGAIHVGEHLEQHRIGLPHVEMGDTAVAGLLARTGVVRDEWCDIVQSDVVEETRTDEAVRFEVLRIDGASDVVQQRSELECLEPLVVEPTELEASTARDAVPHRAGVPHACRRRGEGLVEPVQPGAGITQPCSGRGQAAEFASGAVGVHGDKISRALRWPETGAQS